MKYPKKAAKELVKEAFLQQVFYIEDSILDVLDMLKEDGKLDEYRTHIRAVVNKYRNNIK